MPTEAEIAAWLAERLTCIGASDSAAICGENPFKTALQVYLEKRGEIEPQEANVSMELGLALENYAAAKYEKATGIPLVDPGLKIFRLDGRAWMGCTPDRLAHAAGGVKRNVEIKTTSRSDGWGDPGTDEIPDGYKIQVQHQMHVLKAPVTDLPVIFLHSKKFEIYTVEYDREVGEYLEVIDHDFWQRVQDGRPPEPDYQNPSTLKLLRQMYGVEEGVAVELDPALVLAFKEREAAREAVKIAEAKAKEAEARILAALGEAEIGLCGEYRIKRRRVELPERVLKPSSFVRSYFSRKKGKKGGAA